MTKCETCGAEAVGGSPNCPRCGAPLSPDRSAKALALASFVIGAACALGAAVELLVDYAGDRELGFSLIGLASSIAGWLLVGFPMLSYRKPGLFLPVMGATAIAYLWALERLVGGPGWFLTIALPVALAAMAIGGLTAIACLRARRHGPNIAAIIIVGCAAACATIEAILSLAARGEPRIGWSAIVALAAVPTALLLFGLNHRLRQRAPSPAGSR